MTFSDASEIAEKTKALKEAAAKLGASRVTAVENDPTAFDVARENALKNRVAPSISLVVDVSDVAEPHAVVAANILAHTLVDLAGTISRLVSPGGLLALSGILEEQARQVSQAYAALGLSLEGEMRMTPWVLLEMRRPL